jgi:hypothetical protein
MSLESLVRNGARWDGDTYSIKYFNVSKNFTLLKRGKNTITLAPDTTIVPGTSIQIQLIDKLGNEIPIEYPNQVTPNGDIILHITIGDDIPSGAAKLVIVGTANVDVDTGRALNISAPNIVWRGLTEIKRLDDSDTPKDPDDIVFQNDFKDIKVSVKPIDFTYRDKTQSRPSTESGTGILTYFPVIQSSTFSENVANRPTTRTKETSRPLSSVSNDISTTGIGNPISNSEGYPTIQSTVAEFTTDMVGGVITVTPNLTNVVPPNLQQFLGAVPTYTANIIEVLNETTIKVDTHFYYKVENPETPFIADTFTSNTYSVNYNKNVPTTQGQKVTGYAQMCFDNVATSNGKVDKVRVSAKPVGSIGGPMLLGDYDVITPNKMQDTGSYAFDPKSGLGYKNVGEVTSSNDVTTYYDYSEYRINNTKASTLDTLIFDEVTPTISAPTHNSSNISNAIALQAPIDDRNVSVLSVKEQYLGSAKQGTEYKISLNAYSQKDNTGKNPIARLYISGPSIQEGGDTSNEFGTLIDTISGQDGRLQNNLEFTFTAASDSEKIKLYTVLETGTWEFSNIKVEPTSTTNNSPNEFCIMVPLDNLPVNKLNEEYVFVVDFVAENGNPTNVNLTTQSITLNSNTTLDETLVINTISNSNLIQNLISGSSTWKISDGTTTTDIESGDTLTITGAGVTLSGQTVTISAISANDCTITLQGDNVGICTTIGDFTLNQNSNETITVCHKDTSNLSGAYGTNGISSITVDSLGHVTDITTSTYSSTDTITTVGTSSFGQYGTIALRGSGSVKLSERKTTSGSILTIFSEDNPKNIVGSLMSASYNTITDTLVLNRQSTSSICVNIDSYKNWIVSDGTATSNINDGNTLCVLGCGGITTSLSSCTLTIASSLTESDTLCTVTGRGDTTNVRSCFISSADCNADGGICARGCVHLTANCANCRCDLVIDTLRGSVYICPCAGIGIGTACQEAKSGAITINQLNCGNGIRVFHLPSNSSPTHLVAICNPTSTIYAGDGCQASLQYTSIDNFYLASNPNGYTTCTGTVTSVATNNGITGGTITTTGTIGLTGQALALHNLATNGVIARTGAGTVAGRTITGGTNITVTNGDGVSGNPTISTSATTCTGTVTSIATGTGLTGGTITTTGTISLFHLGFQNLTDPNADRVAFWDDSAGTFAWLTMGSNLTITGTTLNATDTNTDVDVSVSNLVTRLGQINCSTYCIGSGTGVSAVFRGNVSSALCMSADNFITTSDVRLKCNLEPLKDSIDILKKFNSYSYIKNGYVDAGFIAQEVCTAIPYTVKENDEGYLTMRDRPILAYLHSAIIELNDKIDKLENKISQYDSTK